MSKPRCFIFQELVKPLPGDKTIDEYGDRVYLFDKEHQHPPIFQGEEVADAIDARLMDLGYDVHNDFIVVAGSHNAVTALVAVASVIAAQNSWSIKALLYRNADDRFIISMLG